MAIIQDNFRQNPNFGGTVLVFIEFVCSYGSLSSRGLTLNTVFKID